MSEAWVYRADQELPSMTLEWLDRDSAVVDFSTGWIFTAKVAAENDPTTVLLTKVTGVTGAATLPNVVVDWSTTDWAALGAVPADGKRFVVHVYARRTIDNKDRVFSPDDPPIVLLLPAPV